MKAFEDRGTYNVCTSEEGLAIIACRRPSTRAGCAIRTNADSVWLLGHEVTFEARLKLGDIIIDGLEVLLWL
jgi:hypothetical protein